MLNTMSQQKAFKVYESNKHVDTVFFNEDMTANEVKYSLINHDCYSENIEVIKMRGV